MSPLKKQAQRSPEQCTPAAKTPQPTASRQRLQPPDGFAVIEVVEVGHRWFYPCWLAHSAVTSSGYLPPSYFPASKMARHGVTIRRFAQRSKAVHFLLDVIADQRRQRGEVAST